MQVREYQKKKKESKKKKKRREHYLCFKLFCVRFNFLLIMSKQSNLTSFIKIGPSLVSQKIYGNQIPLEVQHLTRVILALA